jgi:glucose-6-phosphate 1-dehydrogenase
MSLVEHLPGPCLAVIFRATGDWTKRKLLGALFRLTTDELLSPDERHWDDNE